MVPFESLRSVAVDEVNLDCLEQNCDSLGRHLIIEMYECLSDQLNDLDWVKSVLIEAAKRAQATIVDTVFHRVKPTGILGVIVIAESHITIHTWPEYRYAAVDIFTCGKTLKGSEAASYIVKKFRSANPSVKEVLRGLYPPGAAHHATPVPAAARTGGSLR